MGFDDNFFEMLLDKLEDSCFPVQVDWNNKELYLKGLKESFFKTIKEFDN